MEKDLGFVAIILIWGGFFYLFVSTVFGGGVFSGGDNFLASAFNSFEEAVNTKKNIIGIFDENGDYRSSTVYSGSADIRNIDFSYQNPDLIFASSDEGLLVSNDGGSVWHVFSDVEHKINSGADVYKIAFDSSGNAYLSVFANNQGILYASRDNFLTVEKLFNIDNEVIYDFSVSGDKIYLGLSDGRIFSYSVSWKTSRVLSSLPSAILKLETGRGNSNLIYATVESGGFYVSRNGGASFQKMKYLNDYRGANNVNDFYVSPYNDFLVYAATDYGLIRSFDGGMTWQVFDSLPSEESRISSVYYDAPSLKTYASSNGKLYVNRNGDLNWQILETGIGGREISVIKLKNDEIIVGTRD